MSDVVFVLVVIGFFALCAAYIHWCDVIVDTDAELAPEPLSDDRRVES